MPIMKFWFLQRNLTYFNNVIHRAVYTRIPAQTHIHVHLHRHTHHLTSGSMCVFFCFFLWSFPFRLVTFISITFGLSFCFGIDISYIVFFFFFQDIRFLSIVVYGYLYYPSQMRKICVCFSIHLKQCVNLMSVKRPWIGWPMDRSSTI